MIDMEAIRRKVAIRSTLMNMSTIAHVSEYREGVVFTAHMKDRDAAVAAIVDWHKQGKRVCKPQRPF